MIASFTPIPMMIDSTDATFFFFFFFFPADVA